MQPKKARDTTAQPSQLEATEQPARPAPAALGMSPETAALAEAHTSVAPNPQSDVAARIVGVSKSFKGTMVLDDITFDVAEGELPVLLGPSGSVQPTTLGFYAGSAYQAPR